MYNTVLVQMPPQALEDPPSIFEVLLPETPRFIPIQFDFDVTNPRPRQAQESYPSVDRSLTPEETHTTQQI